MDQPGLDPAQHQAALEGLRRLSRWPGQRAPLLAGLEALLLAQAGACRVGLLHYDLHRHWAHFYGARCLLWVGRLPPIVQQDGPTSIQQGYTRAELGALAQASLPGAELRWCWPFRWRLAWRRA